MHRGPLFAPLSGIVACAAAPAHVGGGDVLARGGILRVEDLPARTTAIDAEGVTIWVTAELPPDARMQAAYAGVDALARAELLKVIEVHVAEVMHDHAAGEHERVQQITVEAVRGRLAEPGTIEHGWIKVRTGDGVVMRLVARLRVSRAHLSEIVTGTPALDGVAARLLSRLFAEEP